LDELAEILFRGRMNFDNRRLFPRKELIESAILGDSTLESLGFPGNPFGEFGLRRPYIAF
jgi:hypothetical protein